MKPRPVTFDSIDISVHKRYAKDQETLDATFIKEPLLITSHTEITATTSIFSSKWEELFDIQKRSSSWAHFTPPEDFFSQRNRFFSYSLMPDLYIDEEDPKESQGLSPWSAPKIKRPTKRQIIHESTLSIESRPQETLDTLKKDQKTIINLLEAIETLNKLLSAVQARKLQFQKG